jgi:hypothetical protein
MHTPGVVLLLVAAVLLGGCEHAAVLQPPPRSGPDPQLVQSATGLEPAELAALLRLADRVESIRLDGEPWTPAMGHPLDGLSPDQIRQLFAAAGLPAERYASAWLHPCKPCADGSGAR